MISVVIPALNEGAAIRRTLDEIRDIFAAGGLPAHEVIVVDDGSSDETGSVAEATGARVIRHPQNMGYGRSLKDGIAAASHDVIVILDADGTYPALDIPRLYAEFDKGFDLVVGARSGVHYSGSGLKAPLRGVLTFLVEFTVGSRVPDVNSGLRIFRRSTVMQYFPQLCGTFSFTTSMTLAYMLTGRFVSYVPIAYRERVGTTKVRLFRDALRTLQYIVQGIVYYNPVKMFLLLAVAAAIVGIVSALLLAATAGGAIMMTAIGVLAALVIFSLGLVADLLRQILIR
jgi:glycosyltransferase involved in cell wall biosynthesis